VLRKERVPTVKRFYLLSLALGLAAGCAFGVWYAGVFLNASSTFNGMFARSSVAEYAFLQYKHSDLQHSRGALLYSAQFLDDLDAIDPSRLHMFSAALSYGRLALLEEEAGNREQSRAYFEEARQRFKAFSKDRRAYDEVQIRELVQKFDRL
jgi:hypothetical protein